MRGIHADINGRESLILDALHIAWPPRSGRKHIRCPLGTHDDRNPSWRWDEKKARYFCTCGSGSIIDVIMAVRGVDFRAAAAMAREIAGAGAGPLPRPRHKNAQDEVPAPGARIAEFDPLPADLRHPKIGLPSMSWTYRTVDGVAGAVARYETARGKSILPWIWDGAAWTKGAMPAPRPLYQADELAAKPGAPVIVVEGEKTADAAQKLFPSLIATTSAGGALAARQSDWSLLAGRDVVIWPDADAAGHDYAMQVAQLAAEAGASAVRVVDTRGLPQKWDLADEPPPGIDLEAMLASAGQAEQIPERAASAKARVASLQAGAPEFDRTEKGAIARNERNVLIALDAAGVSFSYDSFAQRIYAHGLDGVDKQPVTDAALDKLYVALEREYNLKPAWDDFCRYVRVAAYRTPYHPIRDYLDALDWDGIERISEWLHAYGGAENTELNQAFGRIVLIAAVRRVREPGCKFDEMLVLESPEGRNKSSALALLAGGDDYFSDDAPINCGAREVIERLRGRWIVECSDLKGLKRADIEHLKSFLSRRVDSATLKYEREVTDFRRQCIFVGTTNDSHYLASTTGNRRFWPVTITEFDLDALARDRDQLWAEAAYWEAKGESIRLPQHLWAAAGVEQELRSTTLADPWHTALADALADIEGKISTAALWEFLDKPLERRTQWDHQRLGDIMRRLGWRRPEGGGIWIGGKSRAGYVKGDPPYAEVSLVGDTVRRFETSERQY